MTTRPRHVIPGGLSAKHLAGDEQWRRQAACKNTDPETFFEGTTAEVTAARVVAAKEICRVCLVVKDCLAVPVDSVGRWTEFGLWGGLTAGERQDGELVSQVLTFGGPAIPDLYFQLCAHCRVEKVFPGAGRTAGRNWFCRKPACRRASVRPVTKPQVAA